MDAEGQEMAKAACQRTSTDANSWRTFDAALATIPADAELVSQWVSVVAASRRRP